jgi:hypothetical protein
MEDYIWDSSILNRYTKLATLKNTSEAIRDGNVDMSICYGDTSQSLLCTKDQIQAPLLWFHRIKWNDHLIYLHAITQENIKDNLKIATNEKNTNWLNIEDWEILYSDDDGLITLGWKLKNSWYLVLLKQ